MKGNISKWKILITLAVFITLNMFNPAALFSQTEEKPKYAPGKEKNRNKTDEIGRKQGKWVFYNTFGEKLSEIDFVNDKKEGVDRRFYSYDRVKDETEFVGGIKEGTYAKYFFSSQVMVEGAYKNGKKDGKWTKYFEDGSVRQEGGFINGKRDGVWKTYNRRGEVIAQNTFKNGEDVDELEARKKKEEEAKKAAEKKSVNPKAAVPAPKKTEPVKK